MDDHIGRFYLADTYETGTREGILNGITTLCTFVTQAPGRTLRQAMAAARAKALGRSHADVLWHLTPTTFEPADLASLEGLVAAGYRTIKLYTTYRPAGLYTSYERLGELFRRFGAPGRHLHGPLRGRRHHRRGGPAPPWTSPGAPPTRACGPRPPRWWPSARSSGSPWSKGAALHVVHVSTVEGARAIVEGRAQGDVTCETCPQYLVLDDSWLAREDGHHWLCSPPLRGRPRDLPASWPARGPST